MKCAQIAALMVLGGAGLASVAISGCSSDETGTPASAGSADHAGSAGHSGSAGATVQAGGSAPMPGDAGAAGSTEPPSNGGHSNDAGAGGANVGGGGASAGGGGTSAGGGGTSAGAGGTSAGAGGTSAGAGGTSAGAGGATAGAGGGGGASSTPCGPSSLTKPTVPTDIHVADSAVLVAAYAADGTQTYTCQVTGTGSSATYAWSTASVPTANLYGSTCTLAGTHYAGPHWKSNDGSIILGAKVRSVASSTASSIAQLLLSASVDGGTSGIFSTVTAVQRLNTVGGVAPSTGCDVDHVNGTVAVPYTATYYFYSGTGIIP